MKSNEETATAITALLIIKTKYGRDKKIHVDKTLAGDKGDFDKVLSVTSQGHWSLEVLNIIEPWTLVGNVGV